MAAQPNNAESGEIAGTGLPPEQPPATVEQGTDWKQRCEALEQQCRQMAEEIERLRRERDEFEEAVYALTWEEIPFTREELFACRGAKPTLKEILEELERDAEQTDA